MICRIELAGDEVEAVALVEGAQSLPPPVLVPQTQVLFLCFSLDSSFVLSDLRLHAPLKSLVESSR